jgi:RNA polymerase sigma factor (sigma-70 family)
MASVPDPSATDSTLAVRHCLERHKAGDDTARRELLEISMRRLRLLARTILADIPSVRQFEDTDDLLQNSALRLWKCLKEHRPDSVIDYFRLAACLIRRELIDLSRHHSAHRAAKDVIEAGLSSVGESAIPVARQFLNNEDTSDPQKLSEWTEFHEYVEKLPEEDRSLFDLLWYQGLTLEQSSHLLSIPLRTLGRRWKMARVQLYRDLLSDGDDSAFA